MRTVPFFLGCGTSCWTTAGATSPSTRRMPPRTTGQQRRMTHAEAFITQRYIEGQRWRSVLDHYQSGGRVLDIGAGNGAIELAFAASERWRSFSVETEWNDTLRKLRDVTGAQLRRVVADATHLPFRANTFQAVTLLETVEHLHGPRAVAAEAERVLDQGGVLLLTTPPRWRYAVRPDPHFGIRGLVLLPPSIQRWVAARRGYTRPDHYVCRIYSSTSQLQRVFRGFALREVLTRSRAPRRWFWDAIIFQRQPEPK